MPDARTIEEPDACKAKHSKWAVWIVTTMLAVVLAVNTGFYKLYAGQLEALENRIRGNEQGRAAGEAATPPPK